MKSDAEHLRILDQNFAHSVEVAGEHLVCKPGCTACCHGAFRIDALDAARLRNGMREVRASDPALAQTLTERAQAWIKFHSADFPGDAETGILGANEENLARFDEFANDAPCPALDLATGLCDLYEWRPMTCRIFGPPVRVNPEDYGEASDGSPAFAHCELCFTAATEDEIRACELIVPHEAEAEINHAISADAPMETVVAYALIDRK